MSSHIILGQCIILAIAVSTQQNSRGCYIGITDVGNLKVGRWSGLRFHARFYVKLCNRLKRRQRKYKYMYERIHK
jgi:hypothetical protein